MCGQTWARRTAAVLDQKRAPGIIPPTHRALLHSDFYFNETNKSESQQMDMQRRVRWAICCRSKKDGQSRSRTSDVCWCADAARVAPSVSSRRHFSVSAPMRMRPKLEALKSSRKRQQQQQQKTSLIPWEVHTCRCTCGEKPTAKPLTKGSRKAAARR